MKEFDAIVLGAGPSGSSAAFFLAQAGRRVAIVEKSAFPRKKVCGEFVSATTYPVLEAMGLGDSVAALAGPPVRRVGVSMGDTVVAAPMPLAGSADGLGRALPRVALDPLLLDTAVGAGAIVYQPWKAVAMETTDASHAVTVQSGGHVETLRAPIVVAAHGSWEIGSLPTQPSRIDNPGDLFAFKAFYREANFDIDLMTLVAYPGGYGGMVHNDRDTVGISLCVRRDVLGHCRERFPGSSAAESFLRYVFASVRGVAEAYAEATLVGAPVAAGPLRTGIRPRYADGVFRVGNAAGEAHPAIAEGISMAIQSGCLVAKQLQEASGDRASLDRAGRCYARAWDAQFGGRVRAAHAYAMVCMSPTAGALAAPILRAFPRLITVGATLSGKTKPLDALRPA